MQNDANRIAKKLMIVVAFLLVCLAATLEPISNLSPIAAVYFIAAIVGAIVVCIFAALWE